MEKINEFEYFFIDRWVSDDFRSAIIDDSAREKALIK